jgi:hypothetical protein
MQISARLKYCKPELADKLVADAEEIARMATGLIRKLAPNRKYLKK